MGVFVEDLKFLIKVCVEEVYVLIEGFFVQDVVVLFV